MIKQATHIKWHPVDEKPKEYGAYLITDNYGVLQIGIWSDTMMGLPLIDSEGFWNVDQYTQVIAWMPLPEAYKPPKKNWNSVFKPPAFVGSDDIGKWSKDVLVRTGFGDYITGNYYEYEGENFWTSTETGDIIDDPIEWMEIPEK